MNTPTGIQYSGCKGNPFLKSGPFKWALPVWGPGCRCGCNTLLVSFFGKVQDYQPHDIYMWYIYITHAKKHAMSNESAKSHICASDSRIHDTQMSDGDKSDAQLLLKRHTHVICWGQNGCPTVIVFKMTKIGKYCGVQLLLQSHTFLKRINTVLNFIWHIRDNYFWKLDPVGSTLSYKMIKLCTGSV